MSSDSHFKVLCSLLKSITNQESTADQIFSSRQKLGYYLNRCCYKNAKFVFDYLNEVMLSLRPSEKYSIVLVASICISISYLNKNEADAAINKSPLSFVDHATYNHNENLQHLLTFLKNGGASILILKDITIIKLCLDKSRTAALCIAEILKQNITFLSPIVWARISQKPVCEETFEYVRILSAACPEFLFSGDTQYHKNFINDCVALCQPNQPFSVLENTLVTLKWLTHCKEADPLFISVDNITNLSLKALALECYAEYALYGDLSKIPTLTFTDNSLIRCAYLKIFANAIQNPTYQHGCLKISHWIIDDSIEEFSGEFKTCQTQNILDLSNEELMILPKIAHILPAREYKHIFRQRTKSVTALGHFLKIVAEMPQCIIVDNSTEFTDFIIYCTRFDQLNTILPNVIERNLFAISYFVPHFTNFIIKSLDWFDSCKVEVVLRILSKIVPIAEDHLIFMDVLDSILEIIQETDNLSMSLCASTLEFICECLTFVDTNYQRIAGEIALAILISMSPSNDLPLDWHPAAFQIFKRNREFIASIESDIISNPLYDVSQTFCLLPLALYILDRIPLSLFRRAENIIDWLPLLITICPLEATALAIRLIDIAFKSGKKKIVLQISDVLENEINKRNTPFRILAVRFFECALQYVKLNHVVTPLNGITSLEGLSTRSLRIILKADSTASALLVGTPSKFHIVLENGFQIDDVFFAAVAVKIEELKDWRDEKQARALLYKFGFSQPTFKGFSSWIQRDFTSHVGDWAFLFKECFREAFPLPARDVIEMYEESEHAIPYLIEAASGIVASSMSEIRFVLKHGIGTVLVPHELQGKLVLYRVGKLSKWDMFADNCEEEEEFDSYQIEIAFSKPSLINSVSSFGRASVQAEEIPQQFLLELLKSPIPSFVCKGLARTTHQTIQGSYDDLLGLFGRNFEIPVKSLLSADLTNPIIFNSILNSLTCCEDEVARKFNSQLSDIFLEKILSFDQMQSAVLFQLLPNISFFTKNFSQKLGQKTVDHIFSLFDQKDSILAVIQKQLK